MQFSGHFDQIKTMNRLLAIEVLNQRICVRTNVSDRWKVRGDGDANQAKGKQDEQVELEIAEARDREEGKREREKKEKSGQISCRDI